MISKAFAMGRKALQMLYEDKADVYRVKEEDGTIEPALVHEGIMCHLSLDSKPVINQGEEVATAESQYTLFCLPEEDVLEGDRVVVTHMGETHEYDVGTVFVYDLNRLCRCTKRGVL